MIAFFFNILLALAWIALSGSFTAWNFVFGFTLGYAAIALMQGQVKILGGYSKRIPRFILFLCFFVKELISANLKVAFDIVTPPLYMQPGVIAFPLEAKTDLEITMVANFISLTPGTLSLDVSNDRRVLYIHAMFAQDEKSLREELREIERRILDIMR
ncbi:Na+/H+ antiporter subunit E [Salinispirillum marinum]|uniref:Na+/H+ antiporter subunit E n=2 Tax=Saccharospirillaceae TaxID=255527 RepID=A0ABV8BJP5_9GAMM